MRRISQLLAITVCFAQNAHDSSRVNVNEIENIDTSFDYKLIIMTIGGELSRKAQYELNIKNDIIKYDIQNGDKRGRIKSKEIKDSIIRIITELEIYKQEIVDTKGVGVLDGSTYHIELTDNQKKKKYEIDADDIDFYYEKLGCQYYHLIIFIRCILGAEYDKVNDIYNKILNENKKSRKKLREL